MSDAWEDHGLVGYAQVSEVRPSEPTEPQITISKQTGILWNMTIGGDYDPRATDWLFLHIADEWSPHFFVWSANPYEDATAVPIGLRVRTRDGEAIADRMIPVVAIPDDAHVFDGKPS